MAFRRFRRFVEGFVALGGGVLLVFIVGGLFDGDVGGDGIVLNLLAAGALVLGNGEQEGRAAGQIDGLLDRTLAEGALADHIAALEVFNGGGGKLGSAIGAAVDEHGQRAGVMNLAGSAAKAWVGNFCPVSVARVPCLMKKLARRIPCWGSLPEESRRSRTTLRLAPAALSLAAISSTRSAVSAPGLR